VLMREDGERSDPKDGERSDPKDGERSDPKDGERSDPIDWQGVNTLTGLVQSKKRLEGDREFVFVSFWRHVHVVSYRRARVEEDQGEGGRAGGENDARFGVREKGENERGLHGR